MSEFFNLLASLLWSALNRIHRALYRLGWKAPVRLGVRVVSIGNIQAGGSGKTPLTAEVARQALERGWIPVILTRGYQGERERSGGVLPPVGAAPGDALISPSEWGDEPALLRERVPGAWIGVGADRAGVFQEQVWPRLKAAHPSVPEPDLKSRTLVILDDGFQHLRVHRDLDIVAVTSDRPWERVFRELPGALDRAGLVVWTKGDRRPFPSGDPRGVKVELQVPAPNTRESVCAWWLFTGLGDGRDVYESLKRAGWPIARHVEFRDHARYDGEVLRALLSDMAKSGARAVTTGKDWVKWREQGMGAADGVKVIEPDVVFNEGQDRWSTALWEKDSQLH